MKITVLCESLPKLQIMKGGAYSSQEPAIHASLMIACTLAKYKKSFSNEKFTKDCMDDTAKFICLEVEPFKNVSLSRTTIVRSVEYISTNLADQRASKIKKFVYFWICLNESTDVVDRAQMLIFIKAIDRDFRLTEELLSMESLKDATTGENLSHQLCGCFDQHWGLGQSCRYHNCWNPIFNWEKRYFGEKNQ